MEELLRVIDSASRPSQLGRVVEELLDVYMEAGGGSGGLGVRLPHLVKRVVRGLALRAGYAVLRLEEAVEWWAVKWNMYSWTGFAHLRRVIDVLDDPRPWDELYESLDEPGRKSLMAWLKASLAILFVRPSLVFSKWPGGDPRSYYLGVLELHDRCRRRRELYEEYGVDVCEYSVSGKRGSYTIYTSPMILLDVWLRGVYPEPPEEGTAVDVGAFTGETSVWLYDRGASKVYAIEPSGDAYRLLERVVHVNNLDGSVVPLRVALGAEEARVAVSSGGAASKVVGEGGDVRMTRLDRLVEELGVARVDYIKLDVEGFEESVLMGAMGVLQRDKPVVAVAVYHKPRQPLDVWRLLRKAGYTRFTFRMVTPKLFDVVLVALP